MGRFSQFAVAASKMAVADAGIQMGENVTLNVLVYGSALVSVV